jgi:hypothetical protein
MGQARTEATLAGGGGGASGIWGISDTTGTYTYYSDIASANAAASSGQTIELFANVRETNPVEWVLKDGVKYNMNGYTYTLDSTTSADAVNDILVGSGETHIFNGIIKRASGPNSSGGGFVLDSSSTGKIKLEGVHLINEVGYCTKVSSAKLDGGIHEAQGFGQAIRILNFNAEVKNVRALGSYQGIYVASGIVIDYQGIYVASGIVIDSYAYSQNEKAIRGFGSNVQLINCVGYSNANNGIELTNAGGRAINCTGYSTGGSGLFGAGIFQNCTAYATSSNALYAGAGARVSDCNIYSTGGVAVNMANVGTTTLLQNCSIKSDASQAVIAYYGGTLINCSIDGAPLTYGDCITAGSGTSDLRVFGCSLNVRNASAECIAGLAGTTVYYGNNIFAGNPTLAVGTNVTQGQTTHHDNRGNIEID